MYGSRQKRKDRRITKLGHQTRHQFFTFKDLEDLPKFYKVDGKTEKEEPAPTHHEVKDGGRRTHKRKRNAHRRTHRKKRKHKKSHKKKHRKKRHKTRRRR